MTLPNGPNSEMEEWHMLHGKRKKRVRVRPLGKVGCILRLPPIVGDIQYVSWLPRDIALGHKATDPKGHLMCGWFEDAMQLWEVIEPGENAKARFVGFVCDAI